MGASESERNFGASHVASVGHAPLHKPHTQLCLFTFQRFCCWLRPDQDPWDISLAPPVWHLVGAPHQGVRWWWWHSVTYLGDEGDDGLPGMTTDDGDIDLSWIQVLAPKCDTVSLYLSSPLHKTCSTPPKDLNTSVPPTLAPLCPTPSPGLRLMVMATVPRKRSVGGIVRPTPQDLMEGDSLDSIDSLPGHRLV